MGAYYESRRMAFWNNYYPKILNLTKPESLTKHSGDTDNPRNYTTCSNIGVKLFLNTGFLGFLSSVLLVLPDVFI